MSDWTQQRVAILVRMWANGATCSQIGEELGISRNAAIGKVHRLHLKPRPTPVKRSDAPKPARPRVVRLKPVLTTPLTPMPKPTRKFAIPMGKVSECRWPEGEPKERGFHFCEQPTEPGRPYCAQHCERAYQPRGAE